MIDIYARFIQAYIAQPFTQFFGKLFTPNQISFAGFLAGLASSYSCYLGNFGIGFALWVTNRFFDMMDGAVARATNQQTDFGGYFDIVLDFTVYSSLPFALAMNSLDLYTIIWLSLMFSAFFVNCVSQFYLAGILEKRNAGVISRKAKANRETTTITMPPAVICK